jgi:hypothetical protein
MILFMAVRKAAIPASDVAAEPLPHRLSMKTAKLILPQCRSRLAGVQRHQRELEIWGFRNIRDHLRSPGWG